MHGFESEFALHLLDEGKIANRNRLRPAFVSSTDLAAQRVGARRKRLDALFGSLARPLSDSLAELGCAWALIGEALAVDIDSRRGRAFNRFFFDLRSEGLGDQQPDRDRYQ